MFLSGIRERHKAFFGKSELFFVCMLQPRSFEIERQVSEIEAAQVAFDLKKKENLKKQ